MKHLDKGRKFHRTKDQRKALHKSLAANLILRERIKTTLEKAKETKITVEKLITIAKKQDIVSLRNLKKKLPEKAANKLYYEIAPVFNERKGGYTRIIKTSEKRIRDSSPLAILELVDRPLMTEKKEEGEVENSEKKQKEGKLNK
jgi:large subunit ribosomal protein L17